MKGVDKMLKITLSYLLCRKMRDYGFKTQAEFAAYIGISEVQLKAYMTGREYNPKCETKRKLCAKLDIRTSVLEAAIRQSKQFYGRGENDGE